MEQGGSIRGGCVDGMGNDVGAGSCVGIKNVSEMAKVKVHIMGR